MMMSKVSAACLALWTASVGAARAQPPSDPIAENLFPPELLMQHQQAIGLTDQQRNVIREEIQRLQGRAMDLQWQLQGEVERMASLTKQARVDEEALLAQLDKILTPEREMKRAHFLAVVRIKNALTPEQQARLREIKKKLREGGGGADPRPPSPG